MSTILKWTETKFRHDDVASKFYYFDRYRVLNRWRNRFEFTLVFGRWAYVDILDLSRQHRHCIEAKHQQHRRALAEKPRSMLWSAAGRRVKDTNVFWSDDYGCDRKNGRHYCDWLKIRKGSRISGACNRERTTSRALTSAPCLRSVRTRPARPPCAAQTSDVWSYCDPRSIKAGFMPWPRATTVRQ